MFWKTKDTSHYILCDIGSSSVALALIQKPVQGISHVEALLRTPISAIEGISEIEKQRIMIQTLEISSKKFVTQIHTYCKEHSISLEQAHIVFSSPWYISKTVAQVLHKDESFLLDTHSLTEIVDSEEKKFENDVVKEKHPRFSGRGIHMIEREVMKVMLNGYESPNPYLKKAQDISLSLYMGIVSHDFLAKIDDVIRSVFDVNHIESHTFPLLSYKAVLKLFPHERDLVLVDFGGESTDISFVENGIVEISESFPYGRRQIIKKIATNLNVPMDVAESYLSMMKDGTLDTVIEKNVDDALNDGLRFWIERWNDVRSRRKGNAFIQKVFLTARNDLSEKLSNSIKDATGSQVFQSSPERTQPLSVFNSRVPYDASVALTSIVL